MQVSAQTEAQMIVQLPLADRLAESKQLDNRLQQERALLHKHRRLDDLVSGFLFFCGALSILTTIGFVFVLGSEALKFFSTTEWLNLNKRTVQVISAEETMFAVTATGSSLEIGDSIRLGQAEDSEIAEVIAIIKNEMI